MRLLLPITSALLLSACASYHSTQVRVMSAQGGGIANAVVEVTAQSNGGDTALVGKTSWTTDAAGRANLDARDAYSNHWRITAPGFRPLIVDAAPDSIRIKQYGRKGTNHDAEPLVFVLEPSPPNAASDPKQFESQVDKKPKEAEKVETKAEVKKPGGPVKFEN